VHLILNRVNRPFKLFYKRVPAGHLHEMKERVNYEGMELTFLAVAFVDDYVLETEFLR
jgi:hypothetical protein